MMQILTPPTAASVIALVDAIAAHPDGAHAVSAFKSALKRKGLELAETGGIQAVDTIIDEIVDVDPAKADARTVILRSAWADVLPGSGKGSGMTSGYAHGSPGVLCVLYLEQAAREADLAIQDPQRWFIAIPQIYQALGSVLVAALAGSASIGAYTEKLQREWAVYFDRPDYPDHLPPEGDFTQPIPVLLRRVQDKAEPEMHGRPVVLTTEQKKDLARLTHFRGQMEHVRPGEWLLETEWLPGIMATAAEVIRQLLQERRCCRDLEEEDEERAERAIQRIRALAAGSASRETS